MCATVYGWHNLVKAMEACLMEKVMAAYHRIYDMIHFTSRVG